MATVATLDFQVINNLDVLTSNFNGQEAFERALKLFIISFGGLETQPLYDQMFVEYYNAVLHLYEVIPPTDAQVVRDMMNRIVGILNLERIWIAFTIIEIRGRTQVQQPVVFFNLGQDVQRGPIVLDGTQDKQNSTTYCEMNFQQYRAYKTTGAVLGIRMDANDWIQIDEQLREINIDFMSIHAEGYEDWCDFGRGVQLLIQIRPIVEENLTDPTYPLMFHMYSILQMLQKRVERFETSGEVFTHTPVPIKSRVTYIRKAIDPTIEGSFWSSPMSLLQQIQSLPTLDDRVITPAYIQNQRTVKYNDLHVFQDMSDEMEESVCLCSEWCNWTAFFYHNPIYRFILLQNSQLYLTFQRHNIPEMYLIATVSELSAASAQPITKAPVFLLMDSANHYKDYVYQNYFLKSATFQQTFMSCQPSINYMRALAYNVMRYHIEIQELCIQSDPNSFADICVQNMVIYCKLFEDFHRYLAAVALYVPQDRRTQKSWYKEFDLFVRQKFGIYLVSCFQRHINQQVFGIDYLFSEDFEYSKVLIKTVAQKEVKSIRDHVLSAGNPLNIKFSRHEIVDGFCRFYKYIQTVDPILSIPRELDTMNEVFSLCKEFDDYFHNYIINSGFNFNHFADQVNDRGLVPFTEHLYVFYTLKLYSYGFGIQYFTINAVKNRNMCYTRNKLHFPSQVTEEFVLLFANHLIEHYIYNNFNNRVLFDINADVERYFNEFYNTFWGKARHELNTNFPFQHLLSSGFHQYKRLHYWWTNNGNERRILKKLFDTFGTNLQDVVNRSEHIFSHYILESISFLVKQSYQYYLEVMDVLVYYLVKADCFMITSVNANLIKLFNELRSKTLINKKANYVLTKPGWFQLFKTVETSLNFCDQLICHYIVFEDDFNNISNAINQTKSLVKDLYRDLYIQVLLDWGIELHTMSILTQSYSANDFHFTRIHIAVGLSVLAPFINRFRKASRSYRKYLKAMQSLRLILQRPLRQAFIDTLGVCNQYLRDPNAVQTAMPLTTQPWISLPALVPVLNQFKQLDPIRDLNIDINAANI